MSIVIQLPKDINRFCRTCMNVTENHKDSFDNYVIQNNELTELCQMLHNITSLNVTPQDGLPETLCSQCVEQLTAAYAFIKQCTQVDLNLRSLLTLSEQSEKDTKAAIETETRESSEETNHACQICCEPFTSYYNLSRHMIKHNTDRTLYERFLENQQADLKLDVRSQMVCLNTDTVNLIEERKTSNLESILKHKNDIEFKSITVPTFANQNQECKDFAMEVDVKNETTLKAKNKNVEIECKMCNKKFATRKELISHLCTPLTNQQENTTENSHNLLLTTCSLCNKTFADTSTLSLHFLKHALATQDMTNACIESEFFFCEICGQTFESEFFLQNHYIEEHEKKPTWSCSGCSEIFERESDLLKHSVLHPDVKSEDSLTESVPCVLCNATFPTKKNLLKHSIEHLMKKYSCKKCSLSFCTQHAYFAHLKSHPGYRYTCRTCGKILSTKSALKSHIVGVHSVELRHTCVTCGKSFATPSRLRTHSEIHTNHKKYVCSFCGYSTHKAGDLQIHTRIHTSERPYKCTFANCTMSFKTSSHLCDHVRRHLHIRRFKCAICSVGFSTNHGLKIHQMQHTGERPHSCTICNQKFRRKYHVKVHMKQHESKP